MKTLLEKVQAIDKDAADYIESEVLPRWKFRKLLLKKMEKMSLEAQLSTLFLWELTPQYKEDPEYWRKIYQQLGE